jgi:hypothetical protein
MSDREREIDQLLEPYLTKRTGSDIAAVAAAFREGFDGALASFQKALGFCVRETGRRRESSDKGDIRYVAISALESGPLNKTLDFRIDLLDGRLWLDKNEAAAHWAPRFTSPIAVFPKDEALAILRASLFRVMEYELLAAVLRREMIGQRAIFQIGDGDTRHIVVRLDLAERASRRGARGFILRPVLFEGEESDSF